MPYTGNFRIPIYNLRYLILITFTEQEMRVKAVMLKVFGLLGRLRCEFLRFLNFEGCQPYLQDGEKY